MNPTTGGRNSTPGKLVFFARYWASRTGPAPLAKSRKKTRKKYGKPRSRPTLVAPTLPLPIARMSLPVFSQVTMYAKGIPPTRYPVI